MSELNLGDIPDLSGVMDETQPEPFVDGWYAGTILEKRAFTDKNGNDRVFESGDAQAQKSGRNIRLQVELKRTDGRTLNVSTIVNYQPDDLSTETIQAVTAQQAKAKDGGEWGPLFRPFMTLKRLGALQRIAGVRSLSRTSDGGLDLSPLYGKTAYFKIGPDNRNDLYKDIKDFQVEAPKRAKVL